MHILRHRRLLVLIERTWSGGPLSIDQLCRSALGHPAVNIPRWLGSILLLDSMPVRIDTFQPALSYRSRGDIYKVVTVLCIIPASTFAEVATSCKYSHSYAWQMLNFPSHISKFIHVGPFYSIYNRSQLHLFNLSRTRTGRLLQTSIHMHQQSSLHYAGPTHCQWKVHPVITIHSGGVLGGFLTNMT